MSMHTSDDSELRQLVRQLLLLWRSDWDSTDYISTVLPRLMRNPGMATAQERQIIDSIRNAASPSQWAALPDIAAGERAELQVAWEVQPKLEDEISKFQLTRAHDRFAVHKELLDKEWYWERRKDQIARRRRTIGFDIDRLELREARELADISKEVLLQPEAEELETWFRQRIASAVAAFLQEQVLPHLERYDFEAAQTAFRPVEGFSAPGTLAELIGEYEAQQRAEEQATRIRTHL